MDSPISATGSPIVSYKHFDPRINEAALAAFVQTPVTRKIIAHLAAKAAEVIQCEPRAATKGPTPSTQTPPTTPPAADNNADLPSIEVFIGNVVDRSNVAVPTLMTTLVYLARLKAVLPVVATGLRCTVHRIFLAALILAAKNVNDSSPKNKHWARYSKVRGYDAFGFSLSEVNLMERQLIFLLNWQLNISPEDLYLHFGPFLGPHREKALRDEAARLQLVEAEKRAFAQASRYYAQRSNSGYSHDGDFRHGSPSGYAITDSGTPPVPELENDDATSQSGMSSSHSSYRGSGSSAGGSGASTPLSSVDGYSLRGSDYDVHGEPMVVEEDVRVEMSGAAGALGEMDLAPGKVRDDGSIGYGNGLARSQPLAVSGGKKEGWGRKVSRWAGRA